MVELLLLLLLLLIVMVMVGEGRILSLPSRRGSVPRTIARSTTTTECGSFAEISILLLHLLVLRLRGTIRAIVLLPPPLLLLLLLLGLHWIIFANIPIISVATAATGTTDAIIAWTSARSVGRGRG